MSLRSIIKPWIPPIVLSFAHRVRCVLRVISASINFRAKSYYPEAKKKSRLKILQELIATAWKWRGSSAEEAYFAFGLECKDRDLRDYVFVEEFARIKDPEG